MVRGDEHLGGEPADVDRRLADRHEAMLRRRALGGYRRDLDGVDLDQLGAAGRAVMADGQPRRTTELVRMLAARFPTSTPRALGEMLIPALIPVAQMPPRGLWRAKGGVRNILLSSWLGREVEPAGEGADPVGQELVRRYLAALGPASVADLRAWCGLAGLPAAVGAIHDELVTFRDENGRELIDLPDAPRPAPDTPAPVRFLPAFDNAILGYQDRGRIIDDVHRGLSVAGARVILVDGRVAATWNVDAGTVVVTPLRPFPRAERTDVAEQGRELAMFLSDHETDRVQVAASPR